MGRRSSVLGDFLNVKTTVRLDQFEDSKSRSSYDVPFRSYIFEFGKKIDASFLAQEYNQSKNASVRLKAYPQASTAPRGFWRVKTHISL